jgi:alpha/beta superfamily hydrolase
VSTEQVGFDSADGLRLEGVLDLPDEPGRLFVLCHPHPDMGGTMNAPLLLTLRDELVARRWAVLRFNFRGIGASDGHSSTGEDEVDDALGAIAFGRDRLGSTVTAVGGWSFGGAVAVRAAVADDSLAGCVAIAPAVTRRPGVAAGLPPADQLDLGVPLLIVCGARDDIVTPDECRAWARSIEAAKFVEIAGANHFFWGRYEKLVDTVARWLDGVA